MSKDKKLAQLFEDYIKECRFSSRLSAETVKGYAAVFDLFVSLMPEITSVEYLKTEILVEFFRRLQIRERIVGRNTVKVGVQNSTVKTYWSKLNSFFLWLYTKGILSANPLRNIRPPQPVYEDIRELTEDRIRKLYSAITLHSPNSLILRRDIAMISLLLFCGLRRGEFISLEARDIDFERQLLTVRGNTSKARKIRHIPLHPTVLLHLRDYLTERNKRRYTTQYLIVSCNSDKGLSLHGLKHWVKSLSRKSGVKFHLHQMRHAFACNLARKDVNAVKIQKLLGHASLDMTMTYLRSISTKDMQDDINRLWF